MKRIVFCKRERHIEKSDMRKKEKGIYMKIVERMTRLRMKRKEIEIETEKGQEESKIEEDKKRKKVRK